MRRQLRALYHNAHWRCTWFATCIAKAPSSCLILVLNSSSESLNRLFVWGVLYYNAYAYTMVMRWSWGEMSPQEAQHVAALMLQDLQNLQGGGLDTSLLVMLAGLGSSGANPQHCHQNMLDRLPRPRLPSMKPLKLYLEHSVFGVSEAVSGIIWPHELFANMYHYHKEAFFTYFVPSMDTLGEFWDQVKGGQG